MSVARQNGLTVITDKNKVIVNGEKIPLPKGMNTNSVSLMNGKVYIGGYEYIPKEKKFKRTLNSVLNSLGF